MKKLQRLSNLVCCLTCSVLHEAITKGNPMWNQLQVPADKLYSWDTNSTYIHEPPYFKNMTMDSPGAHGMKNAYCLLNFGESITTDHISPAGSIHKDSPAAKYLLERGVDRKDFNSYGSHRGNDKVMARGTFANIRLVNKLLNGEVGAKTVHIPTGEKLYVLDAAMVNFYSSTTCLFFRTIYNQPGHERYTINLPSKISEIRPDQDVSVTTDNGKSFTCTVRFDIGVELAYFNYGGILP